MIIESIIKRKKGTKVELGDMTYFFNATETEPRHLCEVNNQAHIDRFLSIKEGYRKAEGEKPKANNESNVLLGSSTLPSLVAIAEGKELQLGEIVRGAFELTGLTVSEWNELTDDEREAELSEHIEFLRSEAEAAQVNNPPAPAEVKAETPAAIAVVSAPVETLKPAAGAEFNRDTLLAEAKALKIKSAHLFGNEKLAQAVADAKAKV